MALVHHELCFGCGRMNLFGLQAELERSASGRVSGRCFIKQDHQGPEPGTAHPGVISAALIEAIAFASSEQPRTIEVGIESFAAVGSFLELEAEGDQASASVDGRIVARATAGR